LAPEVTVASVASQHGIFSANVSNRHCCITGLQYATVSLGEPDHVIPEPQRRATQIRLGLQREQLTNL
jgi:hypothetical protein